MYRINKNDHFQVLRPLLILLNSGLPSVLCDSVVECVILSLHCENFLSVRLSGGPTGEPLHNEE
jgi:hypothetical protein